MSQPRPRDSAFVCLAVQRAIVSGLTGSAPLTAQPVEAQAARTIAERGVQLVGTAHGNTLENLLMNPTLSDLVGGIQSVTLGDEEARKRGTQKTVLERKAPPTFDVLIEIQERDRVSVHADVGAVRAAITQTDLTTIPIVRALLEQYPSAR